MSDDVRCECCAQRPAATLLRLSVCVVCAGLMPAPKGPQQLISEGKDRLAGLRARMDQVLAGRDRS